MYLSQIGNRPVGLALFTRPCNPLSRIWSRLIDVASARRKAGSSSGFRVVFGNSHVVFAPRWYGALSMYVLNLPLIAFFGAKLLNRSMLPASRFESAAAFVPFLMSTT